MARSELDIETVKSVESYASEFPHELQTLDVYHITRAPSALWIIFLHGGAWRDPRVTSSVGKNLLAQVLNTSLPTPANAAAINYRLSPHPSFPELTQNTAKHPDHANDVLAGLDYLRVKYGMRQYVLIGHSAGATLAFQMLSLLQKRRTTGLALPKAIFGIEGIYDIASLVKEYPGYREFIEGAFGEEKDWPDALSLGGYTGLAVLAHSDEDQLLSWRQTEEMKGRCEDTLGVGGGLRVVKLAGQHDEVLETDRLVGMVERYLKDLK
ncbi:Alpha/Beta hydrolase protein [Sphaerosporella brunnea]|uniref:Kynurenine formamidase n=1 Tax=Sphaerosporella brunnea TaxID=1250544 RepID=A0A5J5F0Y6_9PEZI|nr:Alpha/Beta hydrolase protein [Sphaerosporella brunnea]